MTIFNFEMLNVPFANGAISTEIAPFPDWDRGLGIAFDQTEGKPEMKGLNGLFQVLTTSMLYLKQRSISEWDSALEYPANAFVTEGAKLYKSKRTNTNKQPSLSQLDWDVWASISDISVSTNGNLKKTVAADGGVTLEVPTATNTQRGAVRQATGTEVANKSNVSAYINPANASTIAQSTDLGVGQTWQNVTGSRQLGVTYTNNTGKPVFASIDVRGSSSAVDGIRIVVGGIVVSELLNIAENHHAQITFIIPAGQSYSAQQTQATIDLRRWSELR